MGFSFRLESVLRYRQRIVDQQGREVALAQAHVRVCQGRLDDLESEISRCFETDASLSGHGLRMQDMVAKTVWLEYLRNRQNELTEDLNRARTLWREARANLEAAWRDLEVLEQLKTKQKSDWEKEMVALERKEMDEIGQIRADQARR